MIILFFSNLDELYRGSTAAGRPDIMDRPNSWRGGVYQGEGVFKKESVIANLYELTQSKKSGRISKSDITVFKSVGASIEDYAAAKFFYETIKAS